GVFVAGYVAASVGQATAFVRKYDTNGNVVWTDQFGGFNSDVVSIAVDGSGIYVVGQNNFDAFVRKYNADGTVAWAQQFGNSSTWDIASGVALDASGVYVSGEINGPLPTSIGDGFVRKYDHDGNLIWDSLFGNGVILGGALVRVAVD